MTTEPAPEPKHITLETRQRIEDIWRARAKAQGLNPRSTKYKTAEVEFFAGAMSSLVTLGYEMPVSWAICALSGRPIVNLEG